MINIGNFFFRYRNGLFVVLYLLLFVPSPLLFGKRMFGQTYYLWPLVIGCVITLTGQLIRGITIGLAYIIRGGKDGKVYAEELVTAGIFNHCRNPLYAGNILMLLGVGILSNSLIFVLIVMPLFVLIYHAIVLAEEDFLRKKFNDSFDQYCQRVRRWTPSLKGLSATFSSMQFNWKRWFIKEYNTQYIWLCGISIIMLFKYPQVTEYSSRRRNMVFLVVFMILTIFYFTIRYLKKTGKWRA